MQHFRINTLLLLVTALFAASCMNRTNNSGDNSIVIENAEMRLEIGSNAKAISLIHKQSRQECLYQGMDIPVFSLTQYRPYDNEIQLTYPAKSKTFAADTVYWKDGDLMVGFELEKHLAVIGVNVTDQYIGFKLKRIDYDCEGLRDKRRTEIDEFTLLQLPVRDRTYFGEWLNVSWDNDVAVNLLATDPYSKIDAEERKGYHILKAGMEAGVKLEGVGIALVTTSTDNLLDRIDKIEVDYNLPRGVMSRRSEAYKYSYYETRDVDLQNIDKHIAYAKKGGFRTISIHYFAFAKTLGHFLWKPEYPNGMADLQTITRKIKAEGLIPGFHIHYNKVSRDDPYVSPVPDHRLNLAKKFTLSAPLDKNSTIINVEENPLGCTLEDGRRLLKTGEEIIEYENYTTERPFQFTGCKRGMLGTKQSSFDAGLIFGLLDVDTWPKFIRIDQNSSLQDEIAEKIAQIYREAGFEWVYFDGAEDVPPPYWFNASMAQFKVYNCLEPKPLFSEGALKPHFGWHILSRGNAFDVFKPEVFKTAVQTYQMKAAALIARDFTSINFGWIIPFCPDETTIGIQPDMFEYMCSRGAAWDCPISLNGKTKMMDEHPRTNDNLEVIKKWEDARIQGFLTKDQKEELKNPAQEHILLVNESGKFELHPYRQLTEFAGGNPDVRAFIFERNNKTWVSYWHCRGEAEIALPVKPDKMQLFEELGKEIPLKDTGGDVVVPVGKRRYLAFGLSVEELTELLTKAEIRE